MFGRILLFWWKCVGGKCSLGNFWWKTLGEMPYFISFNPLAFQKYSKQSLIRCRFKANKHADPYTRNFARLYLHIFISINMHPATWASAQQTFRSCTSMILFSPRCKWWQRRPGRCWSPKRRRRGPQHTPWMMPWIKGDSCPRCLTFTKRGLPSLSIKDWKIKGGRWIFSPCNITAGLLSRTMRICWSFLRSCLITWFVRTRLIKQLLSYRWQRDNKRWKTFAKEVSTYV